MDLDDGGRDSGLNRRSFIKRGLLAGGVLAGGGAALRAAAGLAGNSERADATAHRPARRVQSVAPAQPNILVVLVDQLRFPQWLAAPGLGATGLPPNVAQLEREGVSFVRHYTASNDCSPSRSALLTGLHTHQTGCLITGGSTLDPGFPTWGTMLREHGYRTRWYGKWHLTHHDNWWTPSAGPGYLERYGFDGGTFPSPDGAPGQGYRVDPRIARQFEQWFHRHGEQGPWCTTVSFVNPHDIAWWYAWTKKVAAEADVRRTVAQLPPNYETPEQMIARHKPRLQRSLQATAATSFGPVPFHGPDSERRWLEFMSLYVKLQMQVDAHIGAVLRTLAHNPAVAENTVVVFTSDHGEYGASHGLRGKGASAYEEGIRVPLIVRDPRGELTAANEQPRKQLTSSVDIAPMLLTIGTGSNAWRKESRYEHLAQRPDLTAILAHPAAAGREHVLHATDEVVTEFAVEPYAADAPLHVAAIRTARGKYARYSHWAHETMDPLAEGAESELYDYSLHEGRLELDNVAGRSALEDTMRAELEQAIRDELRAPLPQHLRLAQERGFADYFSRSRRAARGAAAMRKRHTEKLVGRLEPGDTGEGRRR